ncbi:MAG: hypothetical protein IPH77_17630 [Ignavibacteria bacterium]|nr:hypothetical protein [Ignavibacteria bacterium]MBK7160297.1 hypothetical protein [Ignavibacteria bacterium]MBK7255779.1 hypothetical protein [Ignavibacteria bacterium]
MSSIKIKILNPKAKKLLLELAELRLISISEKTSNPFLDTVNKIRSKKAGISALTVTEEVESARSKRYGKRS